MKKVCYTLFIIISLVSITTVVVILLFDKKTCMDILLSDENSNNCIDNFNNTYNISSFYKNSPINGYYINVLKKVEKESLKFLKRSEIKNLIGRTIIFDIDDTLVWTRPWDPIEPRIYNTSSGLVYHFEKLLPMIQLAKEAKKLGYIIIVITARGPEMLNSTYTNLNEFGIYPDKVFTSVFYGQDQKFKAKMRRNLEYLKHSELGLVTSKKLLSLNRKRKTPFNLKIIMTIGDKWTDVNGMENVIGMKLPEPRDMNAYIYYNDKIKLIG